MYYIYILHSLSSDVYYVGQTDDVSRRFTEHNELSEHSYTSRHRPWELIISFEVGLDRGLAMKIERHIKKQRSRAYIESLIQHGTIDKLIARYS